MSMTLSANSPMSVAPAPVNRTNLIVNYLPQNFTDDDFKDLFSTAGTVTAHKIIRDRQTGYSYGFGFIDYESEEEAERAIQILNGYQLQHKRIKVSYARQGENVKGANLYLRNLPKHVGEQDVEQMFSRYGHVVQARVLVDAAGESRGIGFVLFSTREQAQAALTAVDGTTPPGFAVAISVKFAEDNRLKMRPNPMAPISPTNIPLGYLQQYNAGNFQGNGFNGANMMNQFPPGGGPIRNNQIRARFNPIMGGMMGANHAVGPMIPAATDLGFVLFVFNIGSDTDEFELWKLFSPFGTVQKVNVVRDHEKKIGKGYGFVTMANYSEAVGAIHGLNGQDFLGNKLQVSFKN